MKGRSLLAIGATAVTMIITVIAFAQAPGTQPRSGAGHHPTDLCNICFVRCELANDLTLVHYDHPVAKLQQFLKIFGYQQDTSAAIP